MFFFIIRTFINRKLTFCSLEGKSCLGCQAKPVVLFSFPSPSCPSLLTSPSFSPHPSPLPSHSLSSPDPSPFFASLSPSLSIAYLPSLLFPSSWQFKFYVKGKSLCIESKRLDFKSHLLIESLCYRKQFCVFIREGKYLITFCGISPFKDIKFYYENQTGSTILDIISQNVKINIIIDIEP